MVLLALIGLAILAVLLGVRSIPRVTPATITGMPDDPDAMVLGASGAAARTTDGPVYLTANVPLFYPPPLAHLNITTADAL